MEDEIGVDLWLPSSKKKARSSAWCGAEKVFDEMFVFYFLYIYFGERLVVVVCVITN